MHRGTVFTIAGCVISASALAGCKPSEQSNPDPDLSAVPASTSSSGSRATDVKSVLAPHPSGKLGLALTLTSANQIEVGGEVSADVAIVNSGAEAIPFVIPGDGSESGWREPHVFFTAHYKTSGKPAPEAQRGRCGNYDPDWTDEVQSLTAGGRLPFRLGQPSDEIELQEPGEVVFVAHYRYDQGRTGRSKEKLAPPASMNDAPPFELVSNPIAVTVTRPLDLVLDVLRPLKVGKEVALADTLSLRIVHRDGAERTIASPFGRPNEDTGGWLTFEVKDGARPAPTIEHASEFGDPRDGRGGSAVRGEDNVNLPTVLLRPGTTLTLLGPGGAFGTSGDNYTPQAEGSFRLRATYHRRDEGYAIASNWVTVRVDP